MIQSNYKDSLPQRIFDATIASTIASFFTYFVLVSELVPISMATKCLIVSTIFVVIFFTTYIFNHYRIVSKKKILTRQQVELQGLLTEGIEKIDQSIQTQSNAFLRAQENSYANIQDIVKDLYGPNFHKNQFFNRAKHFAIEKELLAEELVTNALIELVQTIKAEHPRLRKINFVFGAGTTISPIFKMLITKGIPIEGIEFKMYTNNLAGIDELQRFGDFVTDDNIDESFHVINGFPSSKYRATHGHQAISFLERLKKNTDAANAGHPYQKEVTVGILTSNWLLVGLDYNKLKLCARGKHHYDFKQAIMSISDYAVVVAPLGKILNIDSQDKLNDVLPVKEKKYAYDTIEIPKTTKTYLLTSFRPFKSNSPLNLHSQALEKRIDREGKNYHSFSKKLIYKPTGSRIDIINIECPHGYIRDNFNDFYLDFWISENVEEAS